MRTCLAPQCPAPDRSPEEVLLHRHSPQGLCGHSDQHRELADAYGREADDDPSSADGFAKEGGPARPTSAQHLAVSLLSNAVSYWTFGSHETDFMYER